MILKNHKNCKIYQEFTEEQRQHFFNLKDKRVAHNIDTLYVTCTTSEDYWDKKDFIAYLDNLKDTVEFEPVPVPNFADLTINNMSFMSYKYCIEKKDCFMLFFARKKFTDTVPPIFVQIRSQFLWTLNEYKVLEIVVDTLNRFLGAWGLSIANVKENRIDFAYHTNYIRNMTTFFDNLNAMQVSHFKRWSKEGTFRGDTETETDYVSIGRRKSNNVFIRIYNKTKEVIEQGYKQFFIEFWKDNEMISKYDKYVYEKCFIKSNYTYMNIARLEFYLEFGSDEAVKEEIRKDYLDCTDYDILYAYANKLTPVPTLITNIEFQTKRKFYGTLDKALDLLGSVTHTDINCLLHMYKLLDNKIVVHNVLTQDVFRLVDAKDERTRKRNKDITPFWKLIQNCDLNSKVENVKVLRSYQRNLDLEKMKVRILNGLASFSLYLDADNENEALEDSLNFLSFLNESDYEKSLEYKKKKAPSVKSKTETLVKVDVKKCFGLINMADGTFID